MKEWNKLNTIGQLKELIENNKKNKEKSPSTNYLNEFSEYSRLDIWYTLCADNIFSLIRIDGVLYFYYFIWDENITLPILDLFDNSLSIVCEYFELENIKQKKELCEMLYDLSFKDRKKYDLWVLKTGELTDSLQGKLSFVYLDNNPVFLKNIYDIFDPIGDRLPPFDCFEAYCCENNMLVAYLDDIPIGGVLYSCKGKVVTEEYIFVKPEFRHRGYAGIIQKDFIANCLATNNEVAKVCAWIEESNIYSIKMHSENGFVKDKKRKVVLVR